MSESRAAIEAGEVSVAGAPAPNPARLVSPHESVARATPAPAYVSRGGDKLAAALARFDLDPTGLFVLDAGSSTGGFTDCALQAGAAHVVAIDVGRGQLHQRLRTDPRVSVQERTNIREVEVDLLGRPADLVVADLSFISLRAVCSDLVGLASPNADLVWLVKPQFEASHAEASEHEGVIIDPAIWRRVLADVAGTLEAHGATIMGLMASPLRGAQGNVEFLVHGRLGDRDAGGPDPQLVATMIDAAVAEAGGLR